MLCGDGVDALCAACGSDLPPPPSTAVRGVGAVPALFAYGAGGARVVQALKFRDGRRLVGPLADGLTGLVPDGPADVVTWLPTTSARRRERGFDQAELLARALARRLDLPCRSLLTRRPGPSQTGRSRTERAGNVVFRARRQAAHRRPIVIDDVCTTGATLRAALGALEGAGSLRPWFVVLARTP